jgi:ATP-dependent DNA helicase RecG
LLLLGKKPKFTLHGANIQYVRFGGITNGSPILNELRFEENILLLVPRLDDFLDAAVIQHWPVPISTLQEKMLYNCPRRALRELLMNVIMHRDYQSNAPIRLYQYEDRLEIMNPGGLYGNARPENFPTVNDYRNPVIAEAMKSWIMLICSAEESGDRTFSAKMEMQKQFSSWTRSPYSMWSSGKILQKQQKRQRREQKKFLA